MKHAKIPGLESARVISPEEFERMQSAWAVTEASMPPLKRLQFASSMNRMERLLDCRRRRDFWELLGRHWSTCDSINQHKRALMRLIQARQKAQWAGQQIVEAMDDAERKQFAELPPTVTVWRGCYAHNVHGLSYSLDRRVAERFVTLNRYCHDGRRLLVEGRVSKAKIAFIKLDRNELEIVALPNAVRCRVVWLLPTPTACE